MMKNSQQPNFGQRYEVLEKVGSGGMGNVYKVYDTVRDHVVALKELSRQHTDSAEAILGFKNEFRVMSEFQHPNIVKVFEFGMSQEKIPFITMEFVSGKNLSELSALSVDHVVNIMTQICQVLAYIHSRLYAHRDLKPDNIKLLSSDFSEAQKNGIIKILDYGLMSQLGVTITDKKISGTFYYMAPEAIVGDMIDESTDLYSLGIIGYELLTGKRPFTGNRSEILQGHLKQIPCEPISICPNIPSSVNAIIMRLIEKDKARRYQNASEVIEDLQYLSENIENQKSEIRNLSESYLYSSKLVGRRENIADFKKCIERLQQGESQSLFIGSPAGMGKTRLLNEMKILTELEGIQSLYLDTQIAEDGIFGWIKALLQQIVLLSNQETLKVLKTFKVLDDEILSELFECLDAITQKTPMVLFLDDLHWTDLKSLQVINKLIRNKEQFRVLIVGSFRNNEVEKISPLWHTIEEGLTEYLELTPMTPQQTRTLIGHLLYPSKISDEFSKYCFDNSGGNVFDLTELLRYMITKKLLTKSGSQWQEPVNLETISLPSKLEERLMLRTENLTSDAMKLANMASVLRDDLNLESWQVVSEYREERFFRGIEELMQNQIIIKINKHYQFAHDKIRDILYKKMMIFEKRGTHLRAGIFLEKRFLLSANQYREIPEHHSGLEMREAFIPKIAKHFVIAEQRDKAVEYSLKAAREAEQNKAEWEAFSHYREVVRFLERYSAYPGQKALLLEIYEKAAQFSSAPWIDAPCCLKWLQKAIDFYTQQKDIEKVFSLSLSYLVTSSITGNYTAARNKIPEIIETCQVKEGTLLWAILFGAGVCLTDWYQGYQKDCFRHAVAAIEIFEKELDTLPSDVWSAYSWALFWRDKARAYLGEPVDMANVEKIRQLMEQGKSDKTIYWHTLTAVTARAAFSGRWKELLEWKDIASQLSKEMGKIYWFECWISHSYLYGAIHHGEFSQLENHIEKVQASPDPYQVRLAYLFRGILNLSLTNYQEAEKNLIRFLEMEEKSPDNSYLEGFIYLARTYLATGATDKAEEYVERGFQLAEKGHYENQLYQIQFLQLKAELAMIKTDYTQAEAYLAQSLNMAEILDNPIQKGFILKLWGRLYLAQKQPERANKQFTKAKDIFLSLDNKYHAGQVIKILESLSIVPSHPESVIWQKEKSESHTSSHTMIDEDANLLRQLDKRSMKLCPESDSVEKKALSQDSINKDIKTVVEKSNLEKTSIEEK